MKRLLIFLLCLPLAMMAQDKPLVVQGVSPDLYLLHTSGPKENFYSIGRIYNISPKIFAPYNNLSLDKGLSIGQVIKIPLNETNFLQSGTPAADEVLVPVYHSVKGKEGLYHISSNYNKVPVATLKKWNNISGDEVGNGTNIIVGYLKVKKDLSPLASKATAMPVTEEPAAVQPEPKEQTPKPVEHPATPKVIKTEEVKTVAVSKNDIVKPEETTQTSKEVTANKEVTGNKEPGGSFKGDYDKQIHGKNELKESGTAAVFKSTSGWDDNKYYCLYNTAAPGSFVKITNTSTGKSVYAKVLDVIPDIKQNADVLVRVSNAAAEQLGISDESKFDCVVEYSK
jgi:hypothetical protein